MTSMEQRENITDISLSGGIRYANAYVLAAVNKGREERGKPLRKKLSVIERIMNAS